MQNANIAAAHIISNCCNLSVSEPPDTANMNREWLSGSGE